MNDASGVAAAPYASGSEATVTGIVTANFSSSQTDVYLQDVSGGVDLFSFSLPSITLAPGDSITVTGSISQFRGLTELGPDFTLLTRHATGRPVPDPEVVTCAQVNATFKPDYTEPNEGRLVRINGVTYNSSTSTITDASGTTTIFIPSSFPPTPSVFDLIAILLVQAGNLPAAAAVHGRLRSHTRTPADIISTPDRSSLSGPYEDHLQPTSVQLHWDHRRGVFRASCASGVTPALGDSIVDPTPVNTHTVTVTGLASATVYSYSVGSADANGSNFSPNALFSTASPPQSTGVMNVYFNKSVDTSVAWLHQAHGNQNLPALLVPHFDNANRSIDAALYSLSGTPGSTLATALINAKNRGVKVRVICEYDNLNSTFNSLIQPESPSSPTASIRSTGAGLMQ